MLETLEALEPLKRLTRDLREAVTTLSPKEARFLVDLYYLIQNDRKRAGNQIRALGESAEPHSVLHWVYDNMDTLESDIRRALGRYAASQAPGRWALSICGIGPVISAGLLAHIDIEQAPTAGHVWRFAGLDPTVQWLGREKAAVVMRELLPGRAPLTAEVVIQAALRSGRKIDNFSRQAQDSKTGEITRKSLTDTLARRPWNADFKTLCWNIGQCFMKVSGNTNDVYGKVYLARKALEVERNEAGQFADQAAAALAAKNYGHDTEAYKAYIVGKLPPAHLDARARRYAVKLLLSHYQFVAYEDRYGTPPPKPYILTQPGHTHFLRPPGWPME